MKRLLSQVNKMKQITINFGDIVNELNKNNLKLGIIPNNITIMCLFDDKNNMYVIENYYIGGYLDKLIKNNTVAKFNNITNPVNNNFKKEIFEITIKEIEEIKNLIG